MFFGEIDDSVRLLRGVGPRTSCALARLGIHTVAHLLQHYPISYEDRSILVPLGGANTVNTICTVVAHNYVGRGSKRALKVIVKDHKAQASLVCFGRESLRSRLAVGAKIYLAGTFVYRFGEFQATLFDFEPYTEKPQEFGRILPRYALTQGLRQRTLRRVVRCALNEWSLDRLEEEVPSPLRYQYGFPPYKEALKEIHDPLTWESIERARRALAYQEFFHLQLVVGRALKKRRKACRSVRTLPHTLERRIEMRLPFTLTEDQKQALTEIRADMESSSPMARLLQGEVGSGKTLVALLSAAAHLEEGGQVALMIPTELLVRQHFERAKRWLADEKVGVDLLISSLNKRKRDDVLERLKRGAIQLIIGTHALFSEEVVFKDLKFIIIDEQHRFGVDQRRALLAKGQHPDLLLMTATPIPRTLALTLFGDLAISSLVKLPAGRAQVITSLAEEENIEEVYALTREELKKGRQAYFVYPLIQPSEKLSLKDTESQYECLSQKIFPEYEVGMIHSRLREEEKRQQMARFVAKEIDILVATSVVEVGIDVTNATVMVIAHADRFGLSSLHQLRGRVGRGSAPSYAFLLYGRTLTTEAKQRMRILKNSSDGFKIAEEDLKLRGHGDLVGVRQSGFIKLTIGDCSRDMQLLLQAREDAFAIVDRDEGFLHPENKNLRELFARTPPFSQGIPSLAG